MNENKENQPPDIVNQQISSPSPVVVIQPDRQNLVWIQKNHLV